MVDYDTCTIVFQYAMYSNGVMKVSATLTSHFSNARAGRGVERGGEGKADNERSRREMTS